MMNVDARQFGNHVIITLQGHFSLEDFETLDRLFASITAQGISSIALDMKGLASFHTAMVAPLLKLRNTLKSVGGKIGIASPRSDLMLILKIAKVDRDFDFPDSLDAYRAPAQTKNSVLEETGPKSSKPVLYQVPPEK